jgi:hypothetical protein
MWFRFVTLAGWRAATAEAMGPLRGLDSSRGVEARTETRSLRLVLERREETRLHARPTASTHAVSPNDRDHSCCFSPAPPKQSERVLARVSTVCRLHARGAEACLRSTKRPSHSRAEAKPNVRIRLIMRRPRPDTQPQTRANAPRADMPDTMPQAAKGHRPHEASKARLQRKHASAQRAPPPAIHPSRAKTSERSQSHRQRRHKNTLSVLRSPTGRANVPTRNPTLSNTRCQVSLGNSPSMC